MADTIANYTGNGTQTDFVVPFDYLKKSFVRVYLDSSTILTGGDYGDTGADYYFLDNTTVRLKTAPADGVLVTIRRYTSATERIVSFKDASILKANDLDTSQLQSFHIAEEARDVINDALIKDEEGNWDAQGNRITNVGDPVDGGDAINLDWYNEDAGKVQQNRDESLQFRNEAEGFRNEAEQFKNQAASSASDAKAAEVAAEESASQAIDANSKAQQALTTVTGLQQQVAADASEVATNTAKVNQQTIQVDSQHTEVGEWHTDVDTKHKDVVQKHTEVTDMYNDLMENTQVIEDNIDAINTVSDNIEDVKNVSNNMPDIDIVSGDLEGTITAPKFTDMGRVGTGKTEEVTVTGGNIKIVADNITDVQKVGDLIDSGQVDTVINAVETTSQNVTKAKQSEDNAKASETNAKTSENLAKDWAIKTDGLVNNEDYSAKYWAQQAKSSADSTSGSAEEIVNAIAQGKTEIQQAGEAQVTAVNSAGTTQVKAVNTSGTDAVASVNSTKDTAVQTVQTASEEALASITSEVSTQVGLVSAEGTKQTGLVTSASEEALTSIDSAGDAQVEAIKTAGTTQTQAVNTAGTTQTKAVNDAGTTQKGLVESEGAKQVSAVSLEGSNQVSAVNSAGTTQTQAVNTAGQSQLATINASVQKAKDWAEKTDAPVEGDAYSAKYWAQQASTVSGQSDWAETNDSSPAFIKNKPDLSVYALRSEISTIYRYKGTVATYDQLPVASQVVGDAYNIATDDKSHGIKAGDNVVWQGEYWDNLSGYVDLSPYLTSEAASGIYLRQDTASTTYATKSSLSSYATKTELSSYATKSELSSYALKTEIPDVSGYQTIAQHNADIQELSTKIDGKMNKITDYGRVGT